MSGDGAAPEVVAHLRTDLDEWLIHCLGRAHRALMRRLQRHLAPAAHIPPGSLSVLMQVSLAPGATQRELADELGLDKANAARLIRSLDGSGWLTRRHPSGDQRCQGVYLTPEGVHALAQVRRELNGLECELDTLYTAEERRTLIDLLRRLG